MTSQASKASGSPKSPPIADAITRDSARDPKATGLLHSARQELLRADAAAHRAINCVSKHERRQALRAATDHTNRALTLMRGTFI